VRDRKGKKVSRETLKLVGTFWYGTVGNECGGSALVLVLWLQLCLRLWPRKVEKGRESALILFPCVWVEQESSAIPGASF
jgi:hypothetical protein